MIVTEKCTESFPENGSKYRQIVHITYHRVKVLTGKLYKEFIQKAQKLYMLFVDFHKYKCYTMSEKGKEVRRMYTVDPTMSFAEAVRYYEQYAKRARSCGRKPVSFLRFITGRY